MLPIKKDRQKEMSYKTVSIQCIHSLAKIDWVPDRSSLLEGMHGIGHSNFIGLKINWYNYHAWQYDDSFI